MALTPYELRLQQDYENRMALLAPFKRILEDWTVETQSEFRNNIRGLRLVASGDLASQWSIKVLADTTRHQVVAEFIFNQHGRFFDMSRLNYTKTVNIDAIEEWIRERIAGNASAFKSSLAEKRGLSHSDPKVIRDLAWRIALTKTRQPKRKWYNKNKEAALHELYPQLQDALAEVLALGITLPLEGPQTGPGRRRTRTRQTNFVPF